MEQRHRWLRSLFPNVFLNSECHNLRHCRPFQQYWTRHEQRWQRQQVLELLECIDFLPLAFLLDPQSYSRRQGSWVRLNRHQYQDHHSHNLLQHFLLLKSWYFNRVLHYVNLTVNFNNQFELLNFLLPASSISSTSPCVSRSKFSFSSNFSNPVLK